MSRTQKNKATEYHIGQLKARLAKLRTELQEGNKKVRPSAQSRSWAMGLHITASTSPASTVQSLLSTDTPECRHVRHGSHAVKADTPASWWPTLHPSLLQHPAALQAGGGAGEGFEVQKYGDGRVALIGFPSVGKSTLLSQLTGTESEVAAYEFTTLTCIPGVVHYKGTKIQLLDLPGIIEGAAHGKGRGRQARAPACYATQFLCSVV
jgi:ribosome-interacting GTPase 1